MTRKSDTHTQLSPDENTLFITKLWESNAADIASEWWRAGHPH